MSGRVLVTGGTGFLGRHLVMRLLDSGTKVRVLARGGDEALSAAGAEVVTGSVLAAPDVTRALDGVEVVHHCAGLVSRDRDHAERLYEVHVQGTRCLMEAAAKAGVGRVIVASTSGTIAVSKDPEPVPDERSPEPLELIARWPYYTSKLYEERTAFRLGKDLGLDVVCVNPSLLLGPGDVRLSSVGDVLKLLNRDVPVVPPGGISFVDARDVADAMISAVGRGRPGARYLLGGANLTFAELFDRVSRISGVLAPRVRLPREATRLGARVLDAAGKLLKMTPSIDPVSAEMSEVYWYLDDALARTELGFSPRDPFETISDTVLDLKARGLWEPKAA